MRILLSAAIIALLSGSLVSAQSLADVARAERARRAGSTVEGVVYTTEQVQSRYPPPVAASEEADPELLSTLRDLRDSILQFGADTAEPTAGLLNAGTDLSGGVVEMLEAFEAGSLDEIERLDTELANPSLSEEDRSALESERLEAQRVLSEVRSELIPARLQSGELQAAGQGLDATRNEIEAAGFFPATEDGTVPADTEEALLAWQVAVSGQRQLVQALADDEVRQLLAITRLRGLVTAPTGSQQERNVAQVELGIADSQLTDIRTALDEARVELERLEAESPIEP